ncbi:hypothetical protein TRIUR3_32477 [Triticum urartu]|uniref:Uncharacterized protein n=1 Tax=Triticum urartu TaxID=4572 RepID=M8A3A0_TRIUA|nr:hypothetical protein TRIUR3_32477 [Triticum urartu]
MTACEMMNEAAVQRHREWAREVRNRRRKASSGRIQGENGGDGRWGRRREHRDLAQWGSSTQEAADDGAGRRRKPKLGRNAERDNSGFWAGSKFSQTRKNELDPRKMEMNMWVKFESN